MPRDLLPALRSWAPLAVLLLVGLLGPGCRKPPPEAKSLPAMEPMADPLTKAEPVVIPKVIPNELKNARRSERQGETLMATAQDRVDQELDLKVYDEAILAYRTCVTDLAALFARDPVGKRLKVGNTRRTAGRLERDCQAGLAKAESARRKAESTMEARVRASLGKVPERIEQARRQFQVAYRQAKGGRGDLDTVLSEELEALGKALGRLDAALKRFPTLERVRVRPGGPTFKALREGIAAEERRYSKERSALRSVREAKVRIALKRKLRGLSNDQRRVAEQHMALPDRKKKRAGGGVCFIYDRTPVEEICFDAAGRLTE